MCSNPGRRTGGCRGCCPNGTECRRDTAGLRHGHGAGTGAATRPAPAPKSRTTGGAGRQGHVLPLGKGGRACAAAVDPSRTAGHSATAHFGHSERVIACTAEPHPPHPAAVGEGEQLRLAVPRADGQRLCDNIGEARILDHPRGAAIYRGEDTDVRSDI